MVVLGEPGSPAMLFHVDAIWRRERDAFCFKQIPLQLGQRD